MIEKKIPCRLDGGTLNVKVSKRDYVRMDLDGDVIELDKKAALELAGFLQLAIHVPKLHDEPRQRTKREPRPAPENG